MKILQILTTVALAVSLFGVAYAGGKGGGGGGGGGGSKGPSKGQSFLPKLIGGGGNGGSSSGSSSGGSNGKGSKPKFHIGFRPGTLGTQRCYHGPVVVVSGPEVLFAPEPVTAEEIASGGTVDLPGDWGREAGYACLMQGETYAYFKILEWTPKGVKLEVPRLDIKEPIAAELVMVRFDRYAFPRIPVIVYPPLAQTTGAVVDTAKAEGKAAEGQTATAAKTDQAVKAVPAADASNVPAELDGEGTFEQFEKETAGNKTK